jgi:hypothetical protein
MSNKTDLCPTGKRPFDSRPEADEEVDRLWHKTDRLPPARSYRCPVCKSWHLTSRHPVRRAGR